MDDDHHELANGVEPLVAHKQDLLCMLVEERMPEHVTFVVVLRERRCQEERHVGHAQGQAQEASDKDAEAVDDELARWDAVDVERGDLASQNPLRILQVYKRVVYSTCWRHLHG